MAKGRNLPPLTAIRAFEAIARLGSFTKAAADLGTTQAAVSYQIKLLEERAGTQLIVRRPRQAQLTEAGGRLAAKAQDAFSLLEEGWTATRGGADGTLIVCTVPTFAIGWLARHIRTFQLRHPKLAFRLDTASRFGVGLGDGVDVEIRGGLGDWPGLKSELLLPSKFTPMLSPSLADTIGGVRKPTDLLRLPLVDPTDPWWPAWFGDFGIPWSQPSESARVGMRSQSYEAIIASTGGGVAMLTPQFYRRELKTGLLVQPFDHVSWDGSGYWLVYPEGRTRQPKVKAFRDWIFEELRAGDDVDR